MIYTVEKEVLPTIFVLFDVFHLFLPSVIIVIYDYRYQDVCTNYLINKSF